MSWSSLVRPLVVAPLAYLTLIAVLRISGKRTLSQLNAFDYVVTVALGSTLASVVVSKDVSLAAAAGSFTVLAALQLVVAWSAPRSARFRRLIKARPTLVVRRGELLVDQLRRQRLAEGEVRQVARQHGFARLEDVGAMVLETDGSLSVIARLPDGPVSALAEVDGWEGPSAA